MTFPQKNLASTHFESYVFINQNNEQIAHFSFQMNRFVFVSSKVICIFVHKDFIEKQCPVSFTYKTHLFKY